MYCTHSNKERIEMVLKQTSVEIKPEKNRNSNICTGNTALSCGLFSLATNFTFGCFVSQLAWYLTLLLQCIYLSREFTYTLEHSHSDTVYIYLVTLATIDFFTGCMSVFFFAFYSFGRTQATYTICFNFFFRLFGRLGLSGVITNTYTYGWINFWGGCFSRQN